MGKIWKLFCSSVNSTYFSIFWGKNSPNFPYYIVGRKNYKIIKIPDTKVLSPLESYDSRYTYGHGF